MKRSILLRSIQEIHTWSIPILQEPISKAVPLLTKKQGEMLVSAWSAYLFMSTSAKNRDEYTAVALSAMGSQSASGEETITAMLEHIEAALE